MKLPRILIAGTHSGCGKTTITAGIMAALARRGRIVQPYKVGPDYIDPMFHTAITGRPSRNLDTWLLAPETIRRLLIANAQGCDLAIIEGVMGFYDGVGGASLEGSTAQLGQLTESPVILVVNAAGMALSVAALLRGFQEFAPGINWAGVIFNQVNSRGHFELLRKIVMDQNQLPVLGYLPAKPELEIPSRHLGLVPGEELADLRQKMDRLAELITETVDLEALMAIANRAGDLPSGHPICRDQQLKVRLGVARDRAFNFYYQDNLDMLAALGAELVYFSPLQDRELPPDLDGVYLGGGFPEVFAAELADNQEMQADLQGKIQAGLPVYAECGGMMYLCNSLTDGQGRKYRMCGVFPARSEMTQRLQHFGYVTLKMTTETILGAAGTIIRGHEFHYSQVLPEEDATHLQYGFEVTKQKLDGKVISWPGGLMAYNALGGYPHLHFESNPDVAVNFLQSCLRWGKNLQNRVNRRDCAVSKSKE